MAFSLSGNEQMIMEAIWKAGRPLTRGEILKAVEGLSSWNPSSVHLVLNSMMKKGAVAVEENLSHYGRTYRAMLTRGEYLAQYAQMACSGETIRERLLELTEALITQPGVDSGLLEEAQAMIGNRLNQLKEA